MSDLQYRFHDRDRFASSRRSEYDVRQRSRFSFQNISNGLLLVVIQIRIHPLDDHVPTFDGGGFRPHTSIHWLPFLVLAHPLYLFVTPWIDHQTIVVRRYFPFWWHLILDYSVDVLRIFFDFFHNVHNFRRRGIVCGLCSGCTDVQLFHMLRRKFADDVHLGWLESAQGIRK